MVTPEIIAQAKTFEPLGEKTLLAIIASHFALGGSNPPQVTAYAGAPTHTPPLGAGIHFDDTTGTQYNYYGGSWH